MEIERKFLICKLPDDLDNYPRDLIRQAYISTDPVIRIRQKNDQFMLTVKSRGLLAREEMELPLSAESFEQLMTKTEGNIIEKMRYKIPEKDSLTIELDIFQGIFKGFIMAEVEFKDLEQAKAYIPPDWFGCEVTSDPAYHNSALSSLDAEQVRRFTDG